MAGTLYQSDPLRRLSGIVILLRTVLPIVLIVISAYVFYQVTIEINQIRKKTQQRLTDQHYVSAQAEIEKLRQEVRRLRTEVGKARRGLEDVNREMRKAVLAVHSTLSKVVRALKSLRNFLQSLLKNIRNEVNKVRIVNIPEFNLPQIRITVPDLNISELKINLKPDLSGIKALQRLSRDVAEDVGKSMQDVGKTVSKRWQWIKVMIILLALWFLSFCGAVFQRVAANIRLGWKLLMGKEVAA